MSHPSNIGIQIGASSAAIQASHEAIQAILNARVDNKTMRAALDALGRICSVNGSSISGCSVNMSAQNDAPEQGEDE